MTAFGYPFAQYNPWGASPQISHGLGINPYAFQQFTQNQPLASTPLSSPITGQVPGLQQPLQQVLPLLQIVPQQLQHLQQLVSVQLQELQQLQQIVQLIPGQLQQLQQLIQFVPQQLQHNQQPSPFQHMAHFHQASPFQQPFGAGTAVGSLGMTPPWGVGQQTYGVQPSHVM
jgi:hypothetical protein